MCAATGAAMRCASPCSDRATRSARAAGWTIVYSGDSSWTDDFLPRARGADLFICECSTYETRVGIHISYPEIAARAPHLEVRRLLLSHLGREPLRRLGEIKLECAQD